MTLAAQIEATLERLTSQTRHPKGPPKLASAIEYAVFPGGARVRPNLCLAVAVACDPEADLQTALAAGVAIELMHCASLVHDDLPCFDDGAVRRGKPAVHVKYGEPLALLAGDALIVMAFEAIGRIATQHHSELLLVLSEAGGAPYGIAAGQAWESEDDIDLAAYHNAKTAALFLAATRCGAVAMGQSDAPWRVLGQRLGEAYQIADDLRDALLSTEELGKPAQQDARHNRPSAVERFGLDGAFQRLNDTINEAAASVPDSQGATALRQLIHAQASRLAPKSLVQQVA